MTSARFVVSGTDTGIGKTVFSAALSAAIGARYWKPVQSGLEDGSDSAAVAALSGLAPERILPEVYRLTAPLSPHRAAELDGVSIDPDRLDPAPHPGPLVIEGAGGLLVPLTRQVLTVDVFARWGLPVILVARTGLGTINHTLLSVEALARRAVPLHGIAFVGEDNPDTVATIAAFSGARVLGRLPRVDPLTPAGLSAAFASGFSLRDFA